MTLGEKLKDIRKRFGLSQEQLADIMNVSRQAITKWETDKGMPDVSNLQELVKVFGVSVDYFLNSENQTPVQVMKKELDQSKYKSKLLAYNEILKEHFDAPWEVSVLNRSKKFKLTDFIIDTLTAPEIGPVDTADMLSDMSPYYLATKDGVKLLVNIKKWVLTVTELPEDTNVKRFTYGKDAFVNTGKLKM